MTAPPLDDTGAGAEADCAAGAAEAEAAALGGGFPGSTITRAPTFTRVKRVVTDAGHECVDNFPLEIAVATTFRRNLWRLH